VAKLVDLTFAVTRAAEWAGLEPMERVAALRVPSRDGHVATPVRSPTHRRPRAAPPVVHDDVLVYRVPRQWWQWLAGRLA